MKIQDGFKPSEVNRVASVEAPKSAEPAPKSPAKSDEVLQVKVSDRAQELAARAERAAELKAQIADGSFKVDADKIASKLVGDDE
jgi:negative regulator of flagellin synthesis FlgM